jgi:exodeoxyribonuclease-5
VDDSAPILISEHQAQLVWEFVGERVQYFDDILFRTQSAGLAASAHRLVEEWQLHNDLHTMSNGDPDAERFVAWMAEFKKHCASNRWFDEKSMSRLVSDVFSQRIVPHPEQVNLYHFAEITPQQQLVFDALTRLGATVNRLKPNRINESVTRVQVKDHNHEIRRAAQWCAELLELQPNTKIGIVVPELEKHAGEIVRAFDQVLTPISLVTPVGPMDRIYNISLGKPLVKQPVVQAALSVLQLMTGCATLPQWNAIFHSPFISGGTSEFLNRSSFMQYLKSKHRDRFFLIDLISELTILEEDEDAQGCPLLLESLIAFQDLRMGLTEDYLTQDYP